MRANASSARVDASSPSGQPKARKPRRRRSPTPTEIAVNGFAVTRHSMVPTRTRGYVLRAFPTAGQAERLNQLVGQGRFLWNWMLGVQEHCYAQGFSLHNAAGAAFLNAAITVKLATARREATRLLTHPASPELWGEHWLADCPRTLVTQKQADLTKAWRRFFEGIEGKPKFKRRSTRDSVRFQVDPRQHDQELSVHRPAAADRTNQAPENPWVKIPNVGRIRVELSEPVYGKITSIVVRRKPVAQRALKHANDRWAGYEIVLTAKDVPVERDRPKHWNSRVDWEADALANGGAGSLGAGLGDHDPAGVVALDLSVPWRGVTSNGDVLGRRDHDPYTSATRKRYQRRMKRRQRQASRKARHRQREAGFGLPPTDPGYRGGAHQPVPLPARNTWTPKQREAMRASQQQQALDRRIARERAVAKRQSTHDAHVFTTALVLAFHTIVVEGLTLKGMAQGLTRAFRRGFNEAAMGEILRMLAYKCDLYGRTLVVADRWFPSSKRCSNPACHHVNQALELKDRAWVCSACGADHERDPNATYNLWQEGCAAVGIATDSHATPLTAGESPVAGRRGLRLWIGQGAFSPPASGTTAADEAPKAWSNPAPFLATRERNPQRIPDRRLA